MTTGTVELETIPKSDLPAPVQRRGVNEAQWRTLCNNLYPGAKPESVLMVLDYCAARNLDPLKKPCHIVPMEVKDARTNTRSWRDVVMPGIYEYRITAQRTGLYHGHTKPQYGPSAKIAGVDAPEWCEMTMFRWNTAAARVVEFPVMVFFSEVVATNREGAANSRWSKAPRQMLTKCTEAAGLRETFPEEFGGEATAEEMDGQHATIEEVSLEGGGLQPLPTAAPRKSTQSQAAPVSPSVTPASAGPVDAPSAPTVPPPAVSPSPQPNIGTIVDVIDRPGGVALIKLNTGYACATKVVELIAHARTVKANGAIVELSCDAPKTQGNAPILREIAPVEREAGSDD